MVVCKGLIEQVEIVAKMVDTEISKELRTKIVDCTENFILELLDYSYKICKEDKRKIVNVDDLKKAVYDNQLEVLKDIFE